MKIVGDLYNCVPKVKGQYAGLLVCDGVLDFAASDIGAVEEIYYATTDTELIISTDFFELAIAKGRLNYDPSEVTSFH